MKFLTVIASTLLFVLISQQYTSALPVDEKMIDVTTEFPHVEHDERNFFDLTTEATFTATKRSMDESNEESKPEQQQNVPETDADESEQDTGDKNKRGETEEHVEEEKPVKEEKPKKVEEHVEEKTTKVEEENNKPSDFCPENYVKFEDSCLFVGPKAKLSARSGKVVTNKVDSTLVENFPVGADNSCPPGTEHTERGVCQKILTEAEIKAKKVAHSCPENAEFVNGQCVFHSFDMMNSTMEMPMETSERPEIHHEEEIVTATESKSIIEPHFETTMQSVIKS